MAAARAAVEVRKPRRACVREGGDEAEFAVCAIMGVPER
jgi:hypothetical protein